jgi:hypothetical protein
MKRRQGRARTNECACPLVQPRARRLDGWVCGRLAGRDQSYTATRPDQCYAQNVMGWLSPPVLPLEMMGTVRRHTDLVRIGGRQLPFARSRHAAGLACGGLAKRGVQCQSSLQSQHRLELQPEYG